MRVGDAMVLLLEDLQQEIGDIEPGPERTRRCRTVVQRRLANCKTDFAKKFYQSMLNELPEHEPILLPEHFEETK